MKHSLVICTLTASLVIGSGVGFLAGWRYRQFDLALQENKIAAYNLKFHGTNTCPAFREFLKARIYCNIYNYYPNDRGYLLPHDWDFGPIDRKVLGPIDVWKDPHQTVFDWEAAIKGK